MWANQKLLQFDWLLHVFSCNQSCKDSENCHMKCKSVCWILLINQILTLNLARCALTIMGVAVSCQGKHPTIKLRSPDETAFALWAHAAPSGECNYCNSWTPLNGHPSTVDTPLHRITDSFHGPNCTQTILKDPDLADTCRPFQQDCPSSLLQLTT